MTYQTLGTPLGAGFRLHNRVPNCCTLRFPVATHRVMPAPDSHSRRNAMRRSTERIITTHPGRLPDPPNRDAVMAARAAGDQATFDKLVREGVRVTLQKQR